MERRMSKRRKKWRRGRSKRKRRERRREEVKEEEEEEGSRRGQKGRFALILPFLILLPSLQLPSYFPASPPALF